MRNADQKELMGGAILAIAGLAVALHAYTSLPMGTVRQMGPGMFPTALGIIIAVLGCLIFFSARLKSGSLPMPEFRPLFAIIGGMLLFALTIDRFGLVVAITLLTLVSTRASSKTKLLNLLVLNIFLCVLAILIFKIGFRMPIDIFRWRP